MSTIKVNSIEPANAGSEDYFLPRVWSVYNAATNSILGDGNVSSVTDNGTGVHTYNFASTLSDANYSTNQTADGPVSQNHVHGYISAGAVAVGTYTSGAVQMAYFRDENSANKADPAKCCIQVVR